MAIIINFEIKIRLIIAKIVKIELKILVETKILNLEIRHNIIPLNQLRKILRNH